MTGRRGFALLAVLWLLVVVTAFAGAAIAVARTGAMTTRNRILFARAAWAREACTEILEARYAANPKVRQLDTADLGRGRWCAATVEDPGAKLNVNTASRDELVRLFSVVRSPLSVGMLVDSVIAWRPFSEVREITDVTGLDSALVARLAPSLTTRGSGAVDVNAAPAEVLRTLPGLGEEAVWVITTVRATRPLTNADELAARLSPSARARLYDAYQNFLRAATFAPAQLVIHVAGGVRGTRLVARATLTCVPLPERLAVVRREVE